MGIEETFNSIQTTIAPFLESASSHITSLNSTLYASENPVAVQLVSLFANPTFILVKNAVVTNIPLVLQVGMTIGIGYWQTSRVARNAARDERNAATERAQARRAQ